MSGYQFSGQRAIYMLYGMVYAARQSTMAARILHVGHPVAGLVEWHDTRSPIQLLVDDNTQLWAFSPTALILRDPAAMIGQQTACSTRTFTQPLDTTGTSMPDGGRHD